MSIESYRRAASVSSPAGSNLADVLERVLDKGVVIAGDVVINLLDIELLTIKLRLLIASVDTAQRMGIDWWRDDPFISRDAREQLHRQNGRGHLGRGDAREERTIEERLDRIESMLAAGAGPSANWAPGLAGEPGHKIDAATGNGAAGNGTSVRRSEEPSKEGRAP